MSELFGPKASALATTFVYRVDGDLPPEDLAEYLSKAQGNVVSDKELEELQKLITDAYVFSL
jgi:hypothetical protein